MWLFVLTFTLNFPDIIVCSRNVGVQNHKLIIISSTNLPWQVSLAVGDAKEVIENAELKKLVLQV